MFSPSNKTRPVIQPPSESSCIRLRVRRKVDLPQPDGPISACTRLASKLSETSLIAVNLPYIAVSFSVTMREPASAGRLGRSAARLRACPERSEWVSSAIHGGPAVDRQPGAQAQHEDHEDQHQRCRPVLAMPLIVWAGGIDEDGEGERCHGLIHVEAQVLATERSEQERRCLAGRPRNSQPGS